MDLTAIIFISILLVILIPGIIIIHRKRDWMITHVYCPPEILFFDTAEERNQVYSKAFIAFIRRPGIWLLYLIYAVAGYLLSEVLKYPTAVWFVALPVNDVIKQYAWISLLMMIKFFPCFLIVWHERKWMRKYFRTYLNEHGKPICMKCGYDLRGLTEQRCPECGKSF